MGSGCKETYEAPATSIVEVKYEGIICQSGGVEGTRNGYGEAIEDDWA